MAQLGFSWPKGLTGCLRPFSSCLVRGLKYCLSKYHMVYFLSLGQISIRPSSNTMAVFVPSLLASVSLDLGVSTYPHLISVPIYSKGPLSNVPTIDAVDPEAATVPTMLVRVTETMSQMPNEAANQPAPKAPREVPGQLITCGNIVVIHGTKTSHAARISSAVPALPDFANRCLCSAWCPVRLLPPQTTPRCSGRRRR